MSQYVNFYLKTSGDSSYACVGSYLRSSAVYEVTGHYLPYEKTKELKANDLNNFIAETNNQITAADRNIQCLKEKQNRLYGVNHFNDEILHMIDSYDELITEAEDEKNQFIYAANFFEFLLDILGMNEAVTIRAGVEAPDPLEV